MDLGAWVLDGVPAAVAVFAVDRGFARSGSLGVTVLLDPVDSSGAGVR